jgi:lysophospholipase L1-like esterase
MIASGNRMSDTPSNQRSKPTPRPALRGLGIALVLAALAFSVAEAGLRVALRLRDGAWPRASATAFYEDVARLRLIYRDHAYLNTGAREGGHVSVFGKSGSLNRFGYRSPERPLEKPPGVIRVVISGGSTTFDVLAPNDQAVWPNRLEARLRSGDHPSVEVWNAGFPGWTSQENVISFAIREADLAPDLAVLFQGANDLQPASHEPFDRQYEHGHAELARRALGLELAAPPWYRRLLVLDEIRAADPWQALRAASSGTHRPRIADDAVATFERNVRSYAALARSRGADILLVTQPMRIRPTEREADLAWLAGWCPELEPSAAPTELERLNEVLRRLAREGVGGLADAAAQIPWADEDFGDPLHYSESGRRKLVDFLAPRLEERLLES